MSALNPPASGAHRTRALPPRLSVVTVAWQVSRDAASPVWAIAAGDGEVELRWVVDAAAGACRVVLVDGQREVLLAEGSASAMLDDGLVHLEATAGEDDFAATLRDEQLLYARTSGLTRAGIAGGRYEVVR